MVQIEDVADHTYRIEILIPGIDTVFAVYLVGEGPAVLIDPGPTNTVPFIQQAMDQLGVKDLSHIIPTHIHMDHAGAAGHLARLFPNAKIVIHPRGAQHAINPSRLIEGTSRVFGDDFADLYGPILPVPEIRVQTPGDGDRITIGERELRIVHTPGHAPHHLAIFDPKTKGLFAGEALGLPSAGPLSPLPAAAPPSFDLEEYLASMEKLRRLSPEMILYSHDGIGKNPELLISKAIENTKIVADVILKALKEGSSDEAIRSKLLDSLSVNDGMTHLGFIVYFKKKNLA
jgi:glyoxylase-like metal-dependent hydrolase (beta-lactamase superfamily II)